MMQSDFYSEQLMSEINVTPFVDVMLVLLIIFMVTAPMMVQGVDVNLPRASSDPMQKNEEHLVITVKQDQSVYINDQVVGVDFLTGKLLKIVENIDTRTVYLRADKSVPYGMVVNVMSKIKQAGVENLGIITVPDEEDS
ncbi:MAG: protein TolR [Thermodesulfobacteriota bacterium]|nr:protein TolR [Thermodesulfobacteriota bacterium]